NWEIFVHPDDSLTFSIYEGDNGTAIQFRGEHSAQYNYKQKLFARRDTSLTPPSFHYLKDLTKYINVLNEWYKSRSIFLENYSIHYHLQKNFVHYSKVNLKYEYIYRLYKPFRSIPIEKRKKKIESAHYFDLAKHFEFKQEKKDLFNPFISMYSMLALT